MPPIDPSQFIAAVQPLLECQDMEGLLGLLRTKYTHEQIKAILGSDNIDARKVATLALALVGARCCIPDLEEQLKHHDPVVNQMAEHALWSIWCRLGTPRAKQELCRGTKSMNRRDLDSAIQHFTNAIEIDPTFAEAYNQRAIAKYLGERYTESIEDCLAAVNRMPCHFGAWAGLGHSYAHEGRIREAMECYERALGINPHLEGVRQAVTELRRELNR